MTTMFRKALYLTIALILLSPLAYYSTGIGQQARALSQEPLIAAGGSLQSSPKAEALHRLTLPLRIEKLLLYPTLLMLLQFSGAALWFRRWIERRLLPGIQRVPGFSALNRWLLRLTRQRFSLGQATVILLYLALFSAGVTLLYLPFSLYSFVLRRQFDLSTQSFFAWQRDFWLGWGIGLLTTLAVYGAFYALLKIFPRRWPLWTGALFTVFTIGYVLLEPLIITPLFYEITPVSDPALRRRIETMANRAGVRIDEIYVIDASRKTNAVNAYFTGFGGASKIFLWDTLLNNHSADEVDVVIAHEMGHWVHKHVLIGLLGSIAFTWMGLFALRWQLNRVWRKLGWRGPFDVAGYPYLLGLMAIVGILTMPLFNGVSRYAENQADDFALAISQKPEAAVAMFEGFARENLSPVHIPVWEKIIFSTHPPLDERIEKAVNSEQ
ncbi:MAG TPA: M48 family peptidase [Anaerolineae bacterium]|nr:M48 family peptidase [Anaerolineae bacterium]